MMEQNEGLYSKDCLHLGLAPKLVFRASFHMFCVADHFSGPVFVLACL